MWRGRAALTALACLPLAVLAPSAPRAGPPPPTPAALALAADAVPDAAAPAARPRVRSVTVALSGDVLIHDNVWASAHRSSSGSGFDFRPMLAPLRQRISGADLALCHLEVPLAAPGGPFANYPQFSAPPQIAGALRWLGYDGCSTASNHSVDQGFAGVARTLDTLDSAGLAHTGTARSRAEGRRIVMLSRDGMRIAWLAATYGTNGLPVDADKPWSVNLIDVDRILADARRARAAGADAVMVALHWGAEYSHAPSSSQLDIADRLTRSKDIALVYGHHAHVVQPVRKVNGTWVVFGLGNLLAGQRTTAPGVNDGMIVEVTLRQRGDGRVRVLAPRAFPTHIDETGPGGEFRVYDVRRALQGRLDPVTRAELLRSEATTRGVVNSA